MIGRSTQSKLTQIMRRVNQALTQPIDVAPIIFFRLCFGLIALWDVVRYSSKGWVNYFYIKPKFYFSYFGFGWLSPLPGDGMYYVFILMGIASVGIFLGAFYRLSTIVFFLTFTYTILLDQTHYLNHMYLVSLVSFLMIFLPAHRAFSIDCWRRKTPSKKHFGAWTLWVLRIQIAIPYVYGGIAKFKTDWLLGEPMRIWLLSATDFPVIGPLFGTVWAPYLFSYGGLIFDLLIVFFLLYPATRVYAAILAIGFHLFNAMFFEIGIFPWFMICSTVLYFPPNWLSRTFKLPHAREPSRKQKYAIPKPAFIILAIHFSFQLLNPFRHYLYPGTVLWNGEGEYFSWHMKIANMQSSLKIYTILPNQSKRSEVEYENLLTHKQSNAMRGHPDMVIQFAQYVGKKLRDKLGQPVPIFVDSRSSLNGRPIQQRIDPNRDLMKVRRTLAAADWILPLEQAYP